MKVISISTKLTFSTVLSKCHCFYTITAVLFFLLVGFITPVLASDVDSDGIGDLLDNCQFTSNADQRDTNGDGYGNICDPDLNNDLIVNTSDLALFKSAFFTADPDADLNGDGIANVADLVILKKLFFLPPGPSGVILDPLDPNKNGVDTSEKFIQTFLVYYGGGPTLVEEDLVRLAKFDLLDIDRFRYNDIGIKNLRENGWTIRDINPGIEIFLYEMGPEVSNYHDDKGNVITLNDLGRYNVARDHSMGSLNENHPELFLHDTSGARSYNVNYSNPSLDQYWYLMDFGSPEYISYWLEAVEADIIRQPWVMDGVHADGCSVFNNNRTTPAMYPDDSTWSSAMNGFVQALVTGLRKSGQKLWANRGQTSSKAGFNDWLVLDQSGNAPDVVMEEGAFAVSWGENSNTRFYPEANWKRQVDLLGRIQNSRVAYLSHTDLGENEQGVDSDNRPVTFWQSMWYALGSFLLGKDDVRDNAYFMFSGGAFNKIWWFEEYEKIDLGRATGPYQTQVIGGTNIYWREFEFGYIYVNPTVIDADFIELPEPGKLITHENLLVPLSAVTNVTSVTLPAHHAAFVRKASSI